MRRFALRLAVVLLLLGSVAEYAMHQAQRQPAPCRLVAGSAAGPGNWLCRPGAATVYMVQASVVRVIARGAKHVWIRFPDVGDYDALRLRSLYVAQGALNLDGDGDYELSIDLPHARV
jgi:hypothetical protein